MMNQILIEALTQEKLIELFGSFYGKERVEEILSYLEGKAKEEFFTALSMIYEELDLDDNDVELKLTLVLKLLSLFKKDNKDDSDLAYEKLMSFLKEKIGNQYFSTILYMMSYILQNSNIINKLNKKIQEHLNKFPNIKDMDELMFWTHDNWYWNEINKTIIEEIANHLLAKKTKINLVWEDKEWKAYHFENYIVARKIGGDTKWCVSSPTSGKDHFYEYVEEGNFELYALVKKEYPKEKYLLAIKDLNETGEYEAKNQEYKDLIYLSDITEKDIQNIVNEFWASVEEELQRTYSKAGFDRNEALNIIKNLSISDEEFSQLFFDELEKLFIRINVRYVFSFSSYKSLITEAIYNAFVNVLAHLLGKEAVFNKIKSLEYVMKQVQYNDEFFNNYLLSIIHDKFMKHKESIKENEEYVANFMIGVNPAEHKDVFITIQIELKDRNNEALSREDEDELLTVFTRINARISSMIGQYREEVADWEGAIRKYNFIWGYIERTHDAKSKELLKMMKREIGVFSDNEIIESIQNINQYIKSALKASNYLRIPVDKDEYLLTSGTMEFYDILHPLIEKNEKRLKEILYRHVMLSKQKLPPNFKKNVFGKKVYTRLALIDRIVDLLKLIYDEIPPEDSDR